MVLVGGLTAASRPDGRLHLFALDIGQGDALLVVAPTGETALIDGGPDPDLTLRRLGERLPFWQRRLDVLVLTHPHEDHLAGLLPALERFEVGMVIDPGRAYDNPSYPRFLQLAAHEPDAVVRPARAGDVIPLGAGTRFRVLYPSADDAAGPLPEDDINNASVVLLLESGAFRALLTGDAEAPVERRLLERGLLSRVDVLKVGHHGSESSTLPEMLAVLQPAVALISCGADNEYGHPHAVTLEHLAALPGLRIRRTDLEGTLEVIADADGLVGGDRAPRDAGSIGPWWYPVAIRPCSCSIPSISRTASWSTRGRGAGGGRGRAAGRGGRRAGRRAPRRGRRPAARHRQARDARAAASTVRSPPSAWPTMGFEELAAPVASHPGDLPARRSLLPARLAVGHRRGRRPARGAGFPDHRRADRRHEGPPSGVRRRPRRGAAAGARPRGRAGRGGRPGARGPGGAAARGLGGGRVSVPLLLAHGDDGFGLDQVLARFATSIGADDRIEIVPERSPDEAAIDRARLESGSVGLFGVRLAVLRQPLRAAGRSTAATERLMALVDELPDGAALALVDVRSTRDATRPPPCWAGWRRR